MNGYEIRSWYNRLKEDFAHRPNIYTKESYEKIDELYGLLKKLEPIHDDNYIRLYFKAPHGTEKEYCDWMQEYGYDNEDIEYYLKEHKSFPNCDEWFTFSSSEYVNPKQGVYRLVSINNVPCIRVEPIQEETDFFGAWDITQFLDWLIFVISSTSELIKNGKYNNLIFKELPYSMRVGKINRNVFWRLFPETKQEYFKLMSEENRTRFTNLRDSNEKPTSRIEMTKSKYLQACALLYRINKMDGYQDLTDWKLFCRHSCSHGLLEGLKDIDDTPEAFEKWMETADFADWGGHAWAIKDGSSRSRIMLRPNKDKDGWYLTLWGGELYSTVEVANGYLALCDNDFPVVLPEFPEMRKKILGMDSIGIVPDDVFPVHCYDMFPDEKVLTFINMAELNMGKKEEEKFICHCTWYPLEYIEMLSR